MNLELKVGTWDGKMIFAYTHANKTQNFDHKMNVIKIKLEENTGMNVNIHPHYGWMIKLLSTKKNSLNFN